MRENPLNPLKLLLSEIPIQQAFEGFAVPRFVAGHFMHGVMDGVQAEFLGFLGQVGLSLGGAVFGFHADAQVFLGAGRIQKTAGEIKYSISVQLLQVTL